MKPRCGMGWFCVLSAFLSGLVGSPVLAEIILLDSGKAVSVESAYVYTHPALRSLVFSSPQSRDMAILPPAPYFLSSPPLLMRAPAPYLDYLAYPPAVYQSGINSPVRPSNRDVTSFNISRAHAFSQKQYYSNNETDTPTVLYSWSYGALPYYPPTNASGGFNQPARPSNRDNATYNLERAHRFSRDAYKKP